MESIGMIGVDLGKRSFQLRGVRADGSAAFRKKVSRQRFLTELSGRGPCTVAMEACGRAHHWGREFQSLGFEVRLVPPIDVKPFVKRHKNDAADAEARLPETVRVLGRLLLKQIGNFDEEIGELDAEVRKRARESDDAKRLMTIPGM